MYFDWCCEFIYDCTVRAGTIYMNINEVVKSMKSCENQSVFSNEDKELIKYIC